MSQQQSPTRLESMSQRIDYFHQIPELLRHLTQLESDFSKVDLPPLLLKLIKMRVSQINGCAFCLHMHLSEALNKGETVERLGLVAAFRESSLFSDAEIAALAWAEEVTLLPQGIPSETCYQTLREHFDEKACAQLTLAIGMINLWNRLAVPLRSQHPTKGAMRLKDLTSV